MYSKNRKRIDGYFDEKQLFIIDKALEAYSKACYKFQDDHPFETQNSFWASDTYFTWKKFHNLRKEVSRDYYDSKF